jgi:glycosyltransferase involved in cell wall biosynthesis
MNILIVSMHFSPGFIGHMKAWYKLSKECGYNTKLFFDQKYENYFDVNEYDYMTELNEVEGFHPNFAVVQNTGFENIEFFKWCTKHSCKIFYILHEPYMGVRELLKDGSYFAKQAVACILNVWLCARATKVILCSQYAKDNCRKYMKGAYKKEAFLPLLFLDDYHQEENIAREYFSMIGTYAEPHGSDIFIKHIKEAYEIGSKQKFQIATRSDITDMISDPIYKKMQDEGQLLVQQGRPLTEEEMSAAYRRSVATWNGYRRSTQSGVLPNAFMQGTPVIATKLGSFEEFVKNGHTGVFIDDFERATITDAVCKVQRAGKSMNEECREFFLTHFYYRNQLDAFKKIVDGARKEETI